MTEKEIRKKLLEEMYAPEDVDKQMIKESVKNYFDADYEDAYCLDLGANIGAFAIIAVLLGAEKVVCIECDSRNFEILKKNVSKYTQIEVRKGAVVSYAYDEDIVTIYKSSAKSNHSSTSTLKRTRNFKEYDTVKAIKVSDLFDEYYWDVIKVDIEGSEVDVLDIDFEIFLDIPIKFIEFHINKKTKKAAETMMSVLRAESDKHRETPIVYFNSTNGYDCMYERFEE